MAPFQASEFVPGADLTADDEILDWVKQSTAFRKRWGTEGMDIDLYVGNCYFYYKPRTDTTTMFCTCEPSENEPDIIVTAIFERGV